MRRTRVVTALAVVLAGLSLAPAVAFAQAGSTASPTDPAKPLGGTLAIRDLFGVPVAKRLLQSDKTDERIRGVERLGSLGTDDAIDALVQALEGGGSTSSDTMVRLAAVRVLAAHTHKENARQVLVRELTTPVGPEARGTVSPLSSLLRSTAALALARAGTKWTTLPLLHAVERGGLSGDAAGAAMKVYPPKAIDALFEPKKKLPPSRITFLGELGDLRAIEKLRPILAEEETDAKLAAVIALAKLGDETALASVRPWLKRGDPRLLKAATEVLIHLGAPEASAAVAALLASDVTRDVGLSLAALSPSRALVEPLTKAMDKLSDDDKPRALALIGRAGGPEAVKTLVLQVEKSLGWRKDAPAKDDDKKASAKEKDRKAAKSDPAADAGGQGVPALGVSALFALATMPGEGAREALGKLLADPRASKEDAVGWAIVRAGVLRKVVRSEAPDGLGERLEKLFGSKVSTSRAVGVLGLVATGAKGAADVVATCTQKKCDEAMLFAAARGALARGEDALSPFLGLLEEAWVRGDDLAKPKLTAIAAGVGLLVDPGGRKVPTSTLAAWAESGGPLAPLAARALPSRDDDVTRGRIERLLSGSDPVVRAHVALGLGKDPEHDAVSLLVNAYRFEDDASVRAAIVRALSQRTEKQRVATLEVARALDPDDAVRGLARAALAGRAVPPPVVLTDAAAWVTIVDNDAAADRPARAGRLVRSDGVAVPFVADPDGVLVVPGLSHQKYNLQL
ncbi:MAG: HEAT repeat domain-containing protein [Polyangiaceae bacterium]